MERSSADNVDMNGAAFDCDVSSQLATAAAQPAAGAGYGDVVLPSSQPSHAVGGQLQISAGHVSSRVVINGAGAAVVYLNGATTCTTAQWLNVAMSAVWHPGDMTVSVAVN